jgi:hypothetical protein
VPNLSSPMNLYRAEPDSPYPSTRRSRSPLLSHP